MGDGHPRSSGRPSGEPSGGGTWRQYVKSGLLLLVGAVLPDRYERRQEGCRRMQMEEDAGEKPEVGPEDLLRDPHQERDRGTRDGSEGVGDEEASARRRSFPYSDVMV